MLVVDQVSVYYGRVQAVRRASLQVAEGEIVALVGSNGAGKSSLLRSIVGLEPASEGIIAWRGRELQRLMPHQVAHTGVALVPEGHQTLPTLSVLDNLLVGCYGQCQGLRLRLAPIGWTARNEKVTRRLERVYALFPRLDERSGQMAGSLSGGEQQMLAIGRALMATPDLLLLDEPSIGLAPNLVREILDLLPHLRDQGVTVLLVEQDARAALRVADRGYVMETGRVVDEGSAQQLLASTRMHRAYLGTI
jgi:branched-chain amino acid transport system ATP-binding protein